MNLKPLSDRIVIKALIEETKTASGIIIPDTASKEKPVKGTIVAVGTGKTNEKGEKIPVDLKIGDKVYFTKYAANEIKVDDEDYLIMREEDILAVEN